MSEAKIRCFFVTLFQHSWKFCFITSAELKAGKIGKTLRQQKRWNTELFELDFQPTVVCFECASRKKRAFSLEIMKFRTVFSFAKFSVISRLENILN